MGHLFIASCFSLWALLAPMLGVLVVNKRRFEETSLTKRLLVLSVVLIVCYFITVYFKFELGFTANNLPLDIVNYRQELFVRNGVLLTDALLLIPFVLGVACSICRIYLRVNIKECMKWFVIGFALHFVGCYFCLKEKGAG